MLYTYKYKTLLSGIYLNTTLEFKEDMYQILCDCMLCLLASAYVTEALSMNELHSTSRRVFNVV